MPFVRHHIWGAFTGGVLCRLFGTSVAGPFTGGVLCRLFGTTFGERSLVVCYAVCSAPHLGSVHWWCAMPFVRHHIWGAFTGGVLCRLFGTSVAGPFTGDVLCRLFGTSVATLALGQSPASRAGTTSTNSSP